MTTTTEKTYEMMWDCEFCGQRKLLGKTHRHCPNCGAPQNPERRYFPPEEEKVAVEDHEFVGADLLCPACQFANSRAAKHCGNCGGPLQGAAEAQRQQEQVVPHGAAAPGPVAPGQGAPPPGAPPAKGKSKAGCIAAVIGLVVVALIAVVVVATCWKKEAGLEVVGHSWKREIAVERFEGVQEKKACKSMPKGATNVKRSKGKPVCKTRKVDQGDGTFKEKKECTEPEEQCSYTIKKWSVVRTEKNSGDGVDGSQSWPTVKLRKEGNCEGCEREGQRTETYTVRFTDTASKDEKSCNFDNKSKWSSYEKGTRWRGQVSVVTGGLDCSSLKPAK